MRCTAKGSIFPMTVSARPRQGRRPRRNDQRSQYPCGSRAVEDDERLAGEVGGRTQRLGPSFPTGCGTSELEQQLAASIKMVETRKQALQATGRPPRKGFPNPPCKFPISLHIGTYPAQAEA